MNRDFFCQNRCTNGDFFRLNTKIPEDHRWVFGDLYWMERET